MSIVRRILALTAVSVVGVVLLAPLSAFTAATDAVPDAVEDSLLPDVPLAPFAGGDRGSLSLRSMPRGVPAGSAERLDASAMPTPGSAPMEATLYGLATPPPAPARTPARGAPPSGDSVWDALAQCESGGNWSINTGNGYYGGLQFNYGTWHDYGGGEFASYPHQATREEQIVVAERLHAARGYAPWPACRAKLGLP